MKILGIKGKNLASLKGEFNIEFDKEPLASAGIFAITGHTGAGKSTILDAMCLALFGQTPRFNTSAAKETGVKMVDGDSTISQGDVKNILRKGAIDGYAEVKFLAQDNNIYASRWSVRRAKNQPNGALQADSLELRNLSTGQPFADKKTETKEEIIRLIGFTFEQFTRSVLLAQNDFTTFLKAKKDEKSNLLEKLTGTEIYSKVSKLIFEKTKKAGEEVERIKTYLKEVKLLEPAQLLHYQNEHLSLSTQIKQLEDQKTEADKELIWHHQYQKLKAEALQAEYTYNEQKRIATESAGRKATWLLIEQVQDAKPIVSTKERLSIQFTENKNEIDKIKDIQSSLNQQISIQRDQLAVLNTDYEKFEKSIVDKSELIKQAEALDLQIGSFVSQINQVKIETEEAKKQEKEAEDGYKEILGKRKQLEVEIGEAEKFILQNKTRENVAKSAVLIIQKLQDATLAQSETASLTVEIEKLESSIESKQSKLRDNQDIVLEHSDRQASQSKKLAELQKGINLVDIQKVKQEIDHLQAQASLLQQAKASYSELLQAENQLKELDDIIESKTKQIAVLQNALVLQKANSDDAKIRKEEAEKNYQIAVLASTDNIVDLRAQLKPNEPCMVCGSTSHPYINENQKLNHVLATLLLHFQNLENEYKQHSDRWLKTEHEIKIIGDLLQSNLLKKPLLESVAVQKKLSWSAYQQQLLIPATQQNIEDYLQLRLDEGNNTILQLKEQENKYQISQAQLADLKEILRNEENRIVQLNVENAEYEATINLEKAKLLQFYESKDKDSKIEWQCINTVSPYFDKKDWQIAWQSDPDNFIERIETFSKKWSQYQAIVDKNSKEIHTIDGSIQALHKNWQEKATFSQKQIEKHRLLDTELRQKQSQRQLIFDGKELSLLQAEWQTIRTDLKQKITTLSTSIQTQTLSEERLHGTIKKTQELVNQLEVALIQNAKEMNSWLEAFYQKENHKLTQDDLTPLLDYTSEWRATESKHFKQIDESLVSTSTTLQERQSQLQKHTAVYQPKATIDEIQNQLTNTTQALKILLSKAQEVDYYLKSDEEARLKSTKYLDDQDQLAQKYENLKKLNDLFGSSDGKKFSLIAQEYTLEILINYANAHLKDLSNRYQLERIPDSLALQVIDQDMGDEIRSVHTLSGGESFIVSLALALGLASLSSNRMSVECLFIDEGFGSLDNDTLRIAMDALERLHSQGRKVGVISHIAEMTERIHTQINVVRLSEGTSKVVVAGLYG